MKRDNNILELVEYVNKGLREGNSVTQIEKNKNVGKDTIRKKLNRAGYYLNKKYNQFIKDNSHITHDNTCVNNDNNKYNTGVITQDNISVITKDQINYNNKKLICEEENMYLEKFKILDIDEKIKYINNITQGKRTLKEIEKDIGFTNIGKYMPKNECYWDGSLKIYKKIEVEGQFTLEEVKILKLMLEEYKAKNETLNVDNINKNDKVITRSIRSYKKIMDEFAMYCKEKNYTQKDAVAIALIEFMKNH